MTRSAVNPLARLLLAFAMTLAALFGSVGFASAASADDDDRGSSVTVQDDDEDDDDEKDGKEPKEPKGDDAATPPPVVEYVDGDVIDKLGSYVKAKAPSLAAKYDEVAPKLRTALADHLTKKGATVVQDSRGRLVIAPYLCDKKKPTWLQPGCVTSLPTPGGGRF